METQQQQLILQKNIVINDPTILAFYTENKHLDFVAMNLLFIDIIKKITANNNEIISSSINQQILQSLKDIDCKINMTNNEIKNISLIICNHLNEQKKDYLDNIKLILNDTNISLLEKTNTITNKTSEFFFTKLTNYLQENIPKFNEKHFETINQLQNDCKKMIENIFNDDEKQNTEIIKEIEHHLSTSILNMQQLIFNHLQTNMEKTTDNIYSLKNDIAENKGIFNDLNNFLNRYKHNSSVKGNISEIELYQILQKIFPDDEIIDTTTLSQSGDFIVNRLDNLKPSILFENKNYEKKINTEEVQKFIRDVKICKKHGILISQNSSITFKKPYQIDVEDGLIMLYLSNVNYDEDKIKIAVDMIDAMHKIIVESFNKSSEIEDLENKRKKLLNSSYIITDEDFISLKKMYDDFTIQKMKTLDVVKNVNKILVEAINNLQLDFLKTLIHRETKGTGLSDVNSNVLECPECGCDFIAKNKASLSAHMKLHKNSKK